MPYKSIAQARYFNANKEKLEKQGVNVNEWNKSTKNYHDLPLHAPNAKKKKSIANIKRMTKHIIKKHSKEK